MKLHIFNPENDLALADGGAAYCPPPAASRIAYDLATLPLWFAETDDVVFLPDELHHDYCRSISSQFNIPVPYDGTSAAMLTGVVPWGWSAQIRRRLKAMGINDCILPTEGSIDNIRALSNRKTSIRILESLKGMGIDTPEIPHYFTEPDDVADFICSLQRSVVKAPWSGSGKGILWGIGHVEPPMENFYKGIIKRQGGVVCEHYLDPVQEFAMEFLATDGKISFAGYSLFNASNGSYSGNIMATDAEIEKVLSQYVPSEYLAAARVSLTSVLEGIIAGSGYEGYLGVDMMIYNEGGRLRLNPCMELNLRMNMGVVSRIFYDRYVTYGKRGRYSVEFRKESSAVMRLHSSYMKDFPLRMDNGRISRGYINLSPVTEESNYIAYVIVE